MDGPATSQPAVQTPRGSKFTKIALIVLGIIVLVVISETGYYFYTQRLGGPSLIPTPTATPTQEREITTIGPGDKAIRYQKAIFFAEQMVRLVPVSTFFLSLNINSVTYGEVASSALEERLSEGVKYTYHLVRINTSGQELNTWLTPEEVAKVKVVLRDQAGETPIKLEDIQPGDLLLMREEINLLADSKEDTITFEISRQAP